MLPRGRLIWVLGLAGAPFLLMPWWPLAGMFGGGLVLLVVLAAVVDVLISPKPARVHVKRDVAEILSLGAENPVRIRLRNMQRREVRVEIADEAPAPCRTEGLPAVAVLPPDRARVVTYHVIPRRRGNKPFGVLFLRSRSRWGFWAFTAEFLEERIVRVYPGIRAVQRTELLARRNRLAEAGVRLSRLRGRGSEFDRLREYRREDEYRAIDWKATARHTTLISREYVVERNQNVVLVLDCGRSMCNSQGGISHFDRALNAAILLAYVALRQGDSVGFLAVSNRVERYVPAMRTLGSARALIARTYDITPRYLATDYELMTRELRTRFRKRSLVVFCTHALDEVHLREIREAVSPRLGPHLVLTAFLRNVPLADRIEELPRSDQEAFQVAAAAGIWAAQTRQLRRLAETGRPVVDVRPEELTARLISQYLEIKAKHLL